MNTIKDLHSRFGFHSTPFNCELGIKELFVHDLFKQHLDNILRAVNKRMSAALIAPSGTGKTTLLRLLADKLPEVRYRVHYIKVTDLSKRDFCREVASAVDAEPAGNYPALVRKLQERFVATLDVHGFRPVILIDEAHDMRPETLGILRILTNFEMDSRLVVSIILSGQTGLGKILRHPKLEDVARRLAHWAVLRPLSRKELATYVQHRVSIAGACDPVFDAGAVEALYEIGRGNLRATDYLALKSLEVAHDADLNIVDCDHVAQAGKMLWV